MAVHNNTLVVDSWMEPTMSAKTLGEVDWSGPLSPFHRGARCRHAFGSGLQALHPPLISLGALAQPRMSTDGTWIGREGP